jgi:malonyl-CoA O-methyltransferase
MTGNTIAILEPQAAYALWAATYPPHAHNALMLAEERAMLSLLPPTLRGLRVLDVGCGSGRYLLHAQHRGADKLIGVDLSNEMLGIARQHGLPVAQGMANAIPLANAWADVTLCGLTLGHVRDLPSALQALARTTKPNGLVLCSDFHPAGHALGWRREFKANGERFAVQHWAHAVADWERACAGAGLSIEAMLEPMLHRDDIPPNKPFDPRALDVPVALVFKLRKAP